MIELRMRWAENVVHMEKMRNVNKSVPEKPEGDMRG
jgi:hypothetical protein